MLRARPAQLVVLLAALLTAQVGLATIARADTESDLDAARKTLSDTQAAANATAAEISEAEGRFEQLDDQIQVLEAEIATSQERADELVRIVRQRAVSAYTRAGATGVSVVLDAADPLEAARRTQLLDRANQKDHAATRKLAALRSDLRSQQNQVRAQRDEQKRVKDQLDVKYEEVQAQLVTAAKARDDLIVRLEGERAAAAAAAAELERLRAEQAAAKAAEEAAVRAAQQSNDDDDDDDGLVVGGSGQILANPGGGSFQCPVTGAAYSNNYGGRGSGFHYGIDMFAPSGKPLVAVKAGTVRYVPNEGAGGNTVYLSADDGNLYFYAHLSSFVGGERSVAQGEIIGLVGATGNASGAHLHFEIRLGGPNGQKINPYPTLQSAGC